MLATKSLTELREPIPQLMQAIEMMSVIAMNLENTDEIGALLDRSTAYLEANVKDLAQKDLIDLSKFEHISRIISFLQQLQWLCVKQIDSRILFLGIDKYTEWNPGR